MGRFKKKIQQRVTIRVRSLLNQDAHLIRFHYPMSLPAIPKISCRAGVYLGFLEGIQNP